MDETQARAADDRTDHKGDEGRRPGESPTDLKRAIGNKLLFFFILGDILGGGIYALVGEVAGEVAGAV